MSDEKTTVWRSETAQQLAEAMTVIDSIPEMQNFLRDVLTEKEILEISSRLEAARMLSGGKKYTDIVAKTKLSSRTIARISDWMQNGCGGYSTVLNQITSHHNHTLPASAV